MFPVVKRQKKNPLRQRNGFSSKYGYTSKSSYLLLFFPIKQGIIREFNGLYFSFQSLFIYTNGAIPL